MAVIPVGLGCMGLTHAYGAPLEEKEAVEVLHQALDMGYDFFDTAEAYTGIRKDGSIAWNEEVVGKALIGVRDKVVIATKMGITIDANRELVTDSRPETIRKSLDASLKRLGTDFVDLYYQHRIDPKVEPEVVAETMGQLIREGKIRAWGISEANEEYLRRAHKVCPVTAIQNRYSMMARWHESLFPVCEELGISFVAFSPMANGFLTGKYAPGTKFSDAGDYRAQMPQFTKEGQERAHELLQDLQQLAETKEATMGQLSLAWMLCKKPYITPIPGSRKPERLQENLGAAQVQLTQEEIRRIDQALDGMELEVFGGHAIQSNTAKK